MGSILTLGYSACSPFRPDVADSATIKEAWDEFSNPADSARTKVWWFHGETEKRLVKGLLQIWRHISVHYPLFRCRRSGLLRSGAWKRRACTTRFFC